MNTVTKNQIISQLKADLPTLPRGLRTVAKYMIDNPADIGLDPIRTTAQKAGVSTNTLVRMAERLGFDSYDALRSPFRQALVTAAEMQERHSWEDELRNSTPFGPMAADAALNGRAIVEQTMERQTAEQMERVAAMLLEARTVYLTGARASYSLAYYLHYVGRMAVPSMQLIPRHMNSPIDELETAQAGDVMIAITFAPYSRETIEACAFARRKGVTLIIISDSEIVSPDFTADETLRVSVTSTYPFSCYAGAMALIEMLIALLVARGGETARARIATYEELRRSNQAYWGGPRKQEHLSRES